MIRKPSCYEHRPALCLNELSLPRATFMSLPCCRNELTLCLRRPLHELLPGHGSYHEGPRVDSSLRYFNPVFPTTSHHILTPDRHSQYPRSPPTFPALHLGPTQTHLSVCSVSGVTTTQSSSYNLLVLSFYCTFPDDCDDAPVL